MRGIYAVPFTKDQLIEYFALALKNEKPAQAHGAREEHGKGRGKGAGKGGGRGGHGGRGGGDPSMSDNCLNCASPEHTTRECPKKCHTKDDEDEKEKDIGSPMRRNFVQDIFVIDKGQQQP